MELVIVDLDDDNDFHLEVTEDVLAEINASGHTDSVINTKELDPYMGFICSFNLDEKPESILDHCTFSNNKSKSTVEYTMIFLLNRFLSLLEEHFTLTSLIDEKNKCRINNLYLIVTGGDYIEGLYCRQA
jgi:hypothetical protein